MDLVTKMISIEAEERRLTAESKHNNFKVGVGILAAILSSGAAIIAVLTK